MSIGLGTLKTGDNKAQERLINMFKGGHDIDNGSKFGDQQG